jgi:hypothetical protein
LVFFTAIWYFYGHLVFFTVIWYFYGHLVFFTAIWSILRPFGIYFPVLVCFTKKNLATLHTLPRRERKKLVKKESSSKNILPNLSLYSRCHV